MDNLFYFRLIALTAGTLVYLFLLALILGHRRPRNFERLLFLLIVGMFFIFSGGLLEANASFAAVTGSRVTEITYVILKGVGSLMLLPLVWQARRTYRQEFLSGQNGMMITVGSWAAYLVALVEVAMALWLFYAARSAEIGLKLWWEASFLGTAGPWMVALAAGSEAVLDAGDWRVCRDKVEAGLFRGVGVASASVAACLILSLGTRELSAFVSQSFLLAAAVAGIMPGAILVYFALRHNFLEYGAQRNLVYGLSATLLALLYLAFVRRVSGWLEPYFPREATAGFLLFILIFLFEPLERVIGPALHRRIQSGMEGLQRLSAELQEQARQGSLTNLLGFAERRVRQEFGLAAVRISIPHDPNAGPLKSPGGLGHVGRIPIVKEGVEIGLLEAATTGAYLTGETSAALEFLAEQLPGLADLAKAIEAKIGLERELAERERLALLGQMAASVSHNLRNPLSSMKTILQVQLENPGLPFDARHDCALVVEEIDRMSVKLTQLLRYSKPSVNGRRVGIVALTRQTAALLGRDAERRNVRMVFDQPAGEIEAIASEEAVSEILSNLLVNAIEAQPKGGSVLLRMFRSGGSATIEIEDEGPGIPADVRSKMFRPFFTTKATGTGLGLSIVARRVGDLGGTVECESPVRDGRGARFRVTLPVVVAEGRVSDAENPDRG